MSTQVLLVEDDQHLASLLADGLASEGYGVVRADSYARALAHLAHARPDVIIMDLLLPDGTGVDLCRAIRRRQIMTPILMLTARHSLADRVEGLDSGADDYLTKPFALPELLARLRALARRTPARSLDVVNIANLVIDLRAHRASRDGKSIRLTSKEFALLQLFATNEGRVVDRTTINAHVWDDHHDPDSNVLEVLVARLRRKIDGGFEPKLIHTLRGSGYRFGVE